jgi:tRNA nucleotidyltransferase (CCA-adding enzyme)
MNDLLPPILQRIFRDTPQLSRAYLVGGCVRDWLLGIPVKDFDVEVFGVGYDALIQALTPWGHADLVGRSFGVVKLSVAEGHTFDFSLSRRDSKTGSGHKGFAIEFDPYLTPEEASSRRDFTINSMMYDPRSGEVLDFHGGQTDLRGRILRHTSPAFVEDPLRVLRGLQFAARFQLHAAPETLELCRSIRSTFPELPPERVREEWFKWASRSVRPSLGLQFLRDTGWLGHFPELAHTVGVPQEPEWHPEGDVWTHTLHCMDALVELPAWKQSDETTRICLALAVLLHDVGKASTTSQELRRGVLRIISPGHELVSGTLAEPFLVRIGSFAAINERVIPLIVNHMAHYDDPSSRAVRRLAARLAPASIAELVTVMTADASGRPPLPKGIPESVLAIARKAAELEVEAGAPKPLLLGRHLIAAGYRPGVEMGRLLKLAFEAQLDGAFLDLPGALEWLEQKSPKNSGVAP